MKRLSSLLGIGPNILGPLLLGSLILWLLFRKSQSTSSLITTQLVNAGFSPLFASYWVAISKFETANWNSDAYRIYHNLFGMGYNPAKDPTAVGQKVLSNNEAIAVYGNDVDSVTALIAYLQRNNYPKDVGSLPTLITIMEGDNYFTADFATYLKGVNSYL